MLKATLCFSTEPPATATSAVWRIRLFLLSNADQVVLPSHNECSTLTKLGLGNGHRILVLNVKTIMCPRTVTKPLPEQNVYHAINLACIPQISQIGVWHLYILFIWCVEFIAGQGDPLYHKYYSHMISFTVKKEKKKGIA